jgi:hypothetical protein
MEDASAVDLDWFWRGWFFTTDHVDIAMKKVSWYQPNTQNPEIEKPLKKEEREGKVAISSIRNKTAIEQTMTEKDPAVLDFYDSYDEYKVTEKDSKEYDKLIADLSDDEKEYLDGDYNFYQIDFENIGGLVMPIILQFDFEDGTNEVKYIPAEIWRRDNLNVSKVFMFDKKVSNITLDPFYETADTDMNNNYWPPKTQPSRFQLYKSKYGRGGYSRSNPMRDAQEKEKEKEKE